MSVINFTLVVQGVHFFIAFILIKHFFFKAAVNQIVAQDRLQESLIGAVQEHQAAISQKEQELREQWQAMRTYFSHNAPSLKQEPLFFGKRSSIIIPQFDQASLKQSADNVSKKLLRMVDHVE